MSEGREKLFGTDGVRGRTNQHPMTAEMALALGRAIAHVFHGHGGSNRHRIIIGKDTRLSGYMFEDALASGICSMGVDVLQVGPMPTPGMAFLTVDMRCDAGVMISASHNPYQDNGIKFFAQDGFKLPDEIERHLEELVACPGRLDAARPAADRVGRARRIDDAEGRYVVFLKKTFPLDLKLDGVRVVIDCANGAAYKVAPTVLEELGAEVFRLACEPDGRNINADCGALYPEGAVSRVREVRAEIGISLDGDADRVVLVSETGEIVDGDALLAICARDLAAHGLLRGGAVVATIMSNLGLEKALADAGVKLVRTQVGDRYVVEAMRGRYNLGGEQSGHVVFLDHNTTGDGMITALQVLAIMQRTGKPLSELARCMTRFPQVLVNVHVAEKPPLDSVPEVCRAVSRVESELGGRGRVVLRYSGTEPKARVMIEGEDEARISELAHDVASCLQRAIGGAEA